MLYDVTVPLSDRLPVYPGDPAFRLEQVSTLAGGDICNLSRMDSGVHAGTHVDAPVHFVEGGAAVHELPLDAMVGPAYVVDATVLPGHVDAAALASLDLPDDAERVLFKTTNSGSWASSAFPEHWVGITPDAAALLVHRGVRLVGVDFLSVAPPGDPTPTHVALLRAGVVVLEGTDLSDVPAGRYDLLCLPLRLVGSDGAPARVLLRP